MSIKYLKNSVPDVRVGYSTDFSFSKLSNTKTESNQNLNNHNNNSKITSPSYSIKSDCETKKKSTCLPSISVGCWSPESKPPSFSPQYLTSHNSIQYEEFDMFSLGESAAITTPEIPLPLLTREEEFDFSQLAQQSMTMQQYQQQSQQSQQQQQHRNHVTLSASPPAFLNMQINIEQAEYDSNTNTPTHRQNNSFCSTYTDDDVRSVDEYDGDELDECGSVVDLDFNLRFGSEEENKGGKRLSTSISPMLQQRPVYAPSFASSSSSSLCVPSLWQRRAAQRSHSASAPHSSSNSNNSIHPTTTQKQLTPTGKLQISTNFLNLPPAPTTNTPPQHQLQHPLQQSRSISCTASPRSPSSPSPLSPLSPSSATPTPSSSACSSPTEDDSTTPRLGSYSPSERARKIQRFHEKRSRRVWSKKILYGCRKSFADKRPRIGGRFVKMVEGKPQEEVTAKVELEEEEEEEL